ncbi:oxidosqualene:lanosterol cyclase [Dactylonectria macrodidyma]|uniref:lanosterol synthase n=1 Tax=Dactylonectria macrodidyma TaxID=307937 RepID=A0A9P9JF90_9HYPO|nr:oxidosqualene:lanosterol cyclase [Dactylonectria macrodidyma]
MASATGRDVRTATSRKRGADSDTSSSQGRPFPKQPRIEGKTDHTRWRLRDDDSRHTWHYLADDKDAEEWPQSYAEKWFLNLPLGLPILPNPESPLEAANNGLTYFEKLQLPSGHWGCEYGGPMFLLPGLVITWYITKTPISSAYATEIKNYLAARAHPDDGGWGLHIEGESTVFGTTLNYIALRLVGVDPEDPLMVKARGTLHKLGGALYAPHWAKFWMAVLGVVDWDLVNPVPPEIWLLPDWLPFAPWRWWIHIRMVFLPMGYLYSKRWSCEETEVTRGLKQELFTQPHNEINWASHRNSITAVDNYHPKSWILNTANWFLANVYNPYLRTNSIKEKAEAWVSELIDMEDANTGYACLAPVNAPMNTLVCYVRDGPDAFSTKRHIERLEEYVWVKDEGMLVNGTNGVQCWDTAFLIQAVFEAGLQDDKRWHPMLMKSLNYLERQQIRENCVDQEKCYRQPRKGGWPFSNKDQGYGVSDCISEALKAIILLQKKGGFPQVLKDQRIFDAIDTLLLYQNDNGGMSSYEQRRGGEYLEMLNAAEVFGRIMIEYDYPECTTACVTAFSLFQKYWPEYRADEVRSTIERATSWIKTNQRPDGSWYGSWGICFMYATMFALESMMNIGETYSNSEVSRRGCDFLLSKQRADGGWSESYKACETMEYHEHPSGSLVVQTAWALIGLMEADYSNVEPLRKGIQFIMDRQQPNGEWLQEAIEGVFNKSCMISYPNYKFTFTIKALGMFARSSALVNIATSDCAYQTMSHITQAERGLAASEARKWDEAIDHLSTALQVSLNPAWLIARSKALIGVKRYQEALDDANLAWHTAYARNKRPLLSEAHYRRAVAYLRLGQYANADACCVYSMRVIKGFPAIEKEDPAKLRTDENGFYKVSLAEAKEEAMNDDINKNNNDVSTAMNQSSVPQAKEWRLASNLRIQILFPMEKLPEDDPARKLTIGLKPEEKGLADLGISKTAAKKAEKKEEAAKPTAAPVQAAAKPVVPSDTPLRLQEFQSTATMSVSIFSKGVNKEKLQVQYLPSAVVLDSVIYPNGDEKPFRLDLWGEIDTEASKYTVTPNKVELNLKKKTPGKWPQLKGESKEEPTDANAAKEKAELEFLKEARNKAIQESENASKTTAPKPTAPPLAEEKGKAPAKSTETEPQKPAGVPYPTSSRTGAKDWDKFGADEDEEEGKDVNGFFKQLFKNSTPEQQRAMMKSFTESNGTALSTDWNDVKDRTVETVPPDGVNAKKWES